MAKIRDLVIDADSLVHAITEGGAGSTLGGESIEQDTIPLKLLKRKFKEMVEELRATFEVESITHKWGVGKTIVVLSDPETNFRYDLYPEYKANRKSREKSKEFFILRKWALKTYTWAKNCEADDVVAYYVRKGAIGISIDKDLLKGVAGLWYNSHHAHRTWHKTTKKEAKKFVLLQTLAGDSVDNIKGLPRVGLLTAEKLLDGDYTWEKVVKIYESKGLTEEDAILTRRLVDMGQWSKKKGVRLWKP